MSKISYRDAAIKPMEFLNVRELQNTISKLKTENVELKEQITKLRQELLQFKGYDDCYERSTVVNNIRMVSLRSNKIRDSWGSDSEDE